SPSVGRDRARHCAEPAIVHAFSVSFERRTERRARGAFAVLAALTPALAAIVPFVALAAATSLGVPVVAKPWDHTDVAPGPAAIALAVLIGAALACAVGLVRLAPARVASVIAAALALGAGVLVIASVAHAERPGPSEYVGSLQYVGDLPAAV